MRLMGLKALFGNQVVQYGLGLGMGGLTYVDYRKEHPESNAATALGYAAADAALWTAVPGLMLAKELSEGAVELGKMGYQAYQAGPSSNFYNPNMGGNYMDTELNATMRQRGVNAIQNNRLNARSVLGSEARSLHQGRGR